MMAFSWAMPKTGRSTWANIHLDNLESVTLYNGQKSEILQSARDFGSSGSIYLRTRYPRFESDKDTTSVESSDPARSG